MTELPRHFPIGGYLELAVADMQTCERSVWEVWTEHRPTFTFRNARSALVWLLESLGCPRVWLPAYLCRDVVEAVEVTAKCRAAFYPVGSDLCSEVDFIEKVPDGDAVVWVRYFGRPMSPVAVDAVKARPGILHIEDRALALDADDSVCNWMLYSPRKLLGVPDGGLAVHNRGEIPDRPPPPPKDPDAILAAVAPRLLRLEDPSMQSMQYQSYVKAEEAMAADMREPARLTLEILRRLSFSTISTARRGNWAQLYRSLGHLCLWQEPEPYWTPAGLPIVVKSAESLGSALASEGIFCPRHWHPLQSPGDSFPEEHMLSRGLLTLPCDHRLSIDDKERLVEAVLRLVTTTGC
ncbi:MAG: hypothetical protein GY849_16105 [Deltaproteobacteria bacterium]|nr:hypothetical protein [Deltaproteobacteria bacterium]